MDFQNKLKVEESRPEVEISRRNFLKMVPALSTMTLLLASCDTKVKILVEGTIKEEGEKLEKEIGDSLNKLSKGITETILQDSKENKVVIHVSKLPFISDFIEKRLGETIEINAPENLQDIFNKIQEVVDDINNQVEGKMLEGINAMKLEYSTGKARPDDVAFAELKLTVALNGVEIELHIFTLIAGETNEKLGQIIIGANPNFVRLYVENGKFVPASNEGN